MFKPCYAQGNIKKTCRKAKDGIVSALNINTELIALKDIDSRIVTTKNTTWNAEALS